MRDLRSVPTMPSVRVLPFFSKTKVEQASGTQPASRGGLDPLGREQQTKKVAVRLWTEAVKKRREISSLLQSEHPRAERVDAGCLRHLGRA